MEPPRPAVPAFPCRAPCARTGTPRCPACPRPPSLVSFPHFPEPPAEAEAAEPSELLRLHNLPRASAGSRWHPPWQGLRGLVRLVGHPKAVPAPGQGRGQVSGAARGQAGQGLGSLGTNWVAPRCHGSVCGAGALQPPAAWDRERPTATGGRDTKPLRHKSPGPPFCLLLGQRAPSTRWRRAASLGSPRQDVGTQGAGARRLSPHGPVGGRWGFGAAHRGCLELEEHEGSPTCRANNHRGCRRAVGRAAAS